MKKLVFLGIFSLGVAFSASATYQCVVSASGGNDGFCRKLSSGNGDMCFTFGEGPACSSTIGEQDS